MCFHPARKSLTLAMAAALVAATGGSALAQALHLPAQGRDGGGTRLRVVNGFAQNLSTLYLTEPPGVEAPRPSTGLFGIPGSVRVHDGLIYAVISQSRLGGPPGGAGGLTGLDLASGFTRFYVHLESATRNPWDIAFRSDGLALVSNWRAFDPLATDYRLTILQAGALAPLGHVFLPNPLLGTGDAELSPAGMTVAGNFLFVCCTGWSFQLFDYNPGSVAVINLTTLEPVDTNGNPADGITPLLTSTRNPSVVSLGPDGELYVLCSGNFGVFSGNPHEPGAVDVFDFLSPTPKATIPIGGLSAPISMAFTPDGRAYLGDGVGPLVYSFDVTTDAALRDASNPIVLPQAKLYGYVSDFAFIDDTRVLAVEFNEEAAYVWSLDDDDNVSDPGVTVYADLNPHDSGFLGPQWLIPVPERP
ncbi:MAG: hypothetical protein AB1486_15090 [Planctomycetota bacterium]